MRFGGRRCDGCRASRPARRLGSKTLGTIMVGVDCDAERRIASAADARTAGTNVSGCTRCEGMPTQG
eukprot:IDg1713t1